MWRMTVEDLIAELQKHDPKLPVVVPLRNQGCPKFRICVQVDQASVVNADIESGKYLVHDAYGEREKGIDEVPVLLITGF